MKPQWTPGNRFELLENGEAFYPRVLAAIGEARREVLLETFILFDDAVGRRLRAALLAAARRGVRVHVLVDGWGSPDLDEHFVQPLVDAGVQWRVFEPAVRWFGWRVNPLRHMHRKLVVVDGALAFVGGINFSVDHLVEHGPEAKQDYAVALQGPVVAQVHAFCRQHLDDADTAAGPPWWRGWRARWQGRWQGRREATRTRPGDAGWAAFVVRDNLRHRHDIERQYRLALRSARSRVVIANAYFFPGWRLLRDMRRAARRGVRVDLILQGQPDMPIVQQAASLLYDALVRAGVHVHEYCERPLHGKVAVVDGQWATVGSSNLDPTSLGLNLEANVLISDRGFARTLQGRLQALIDHRCRAIHAEHRPATLQWLDRVRGAALHHVLRHWPRWAQALPARPPAIRPLERRPCA